MPIIITRRTILVYVIILNGKGSSNWMWLIWIQYCFPYLFITGQPKHFFVSNLFACFVPVIVLSNGGLHQVEVLQTPTQSF